MIQVNQKPRNKASVHVARDLSCPGKMLEEPPMKKLIRHMKKAEWGFTLIELVVVIAILGVMAAIAVPMVNNFLGSAKAQSWTTDRAIVQTSVDAWVSSPSNARFLGQRQYPIIGADKTGDVFIRADHNHDSQHPDSHAHHDKDHKLVNKGGHHHIQIEHDLAELGNPLGGTQGGNPKWIDGGNGIRDADEEELLDNDPGSLDKSGWHVATVTREGTEYIVDSRDYFIDFTKLVNAGLLEKVPTSGSTDDVGGTASGSYGWYVDPDGRVKSLYFFFPESDQTGFQQAYP